MVEYENKVGSVVRSGCPLKHRVSSLLSLSLYAHSVRNIIEYSPSARVRFSRDSRSVSGASRRVCPSGRKLKFLRMRSGISAAICGYRYRTRSLSKGIARYTTRRLRSYTNCGGRNHCIIQDGLHLGEDYYWLIRSKRPRLGSRLVTG